jgi:S1-C subfamily serine protease
MFPIFNKNELVAEKETYQNLVLRGGAGLAGKVIAKEPKADLALIQLDRLPQGTTALALAANGVGPGDDVHSIGNPAASGALWAYTRGSVKAVYRKNFRTSGRDGEGAFEIDARVVETSSPVNAGDSGGPVVNSNGELVAITQGHLADEAARSISYFIDLSEIKAFLKAKGHGRVVTQPAAISASATEAKAEDKASAKDPAVDKAEKAEKEAASKLTLVQLLIKDHPDRARDRLEEIVKNYPDTKAAQEAKELLAKLKK